MANFSGADLGRAHLRSAHLSGANFRGADLRAVDLREAYLDGADLRDAKAWGLTLPLLICAG